MSDESVVYLNTFINDKTLNNKVEEDPAKLYKHRLDIITFVVNDIADKPLASKISELLKLIFYDQQNYYLYYLLGYYYKIDSQFDHARTFFHLSINLNPEFLNNYVELGLMYQNIDNPLSIKYLKRALEFKNLTEFEKTSVVFSLSLVYMDAFMYQESEECMLSIINSPTTATETKTKAIINLGTLHTLMGKVITDLSYCDSLNNVQVLHSKLLMLNNNNKYNGLEILKEHLKINEFYKDYVRFKHPQPDQQPPLQPPLQPPQPDQQPDQNQKIKLGYVSSDLKSHVVIKFMYNILKEHDCSKFDIYIFYNYKLYDPITHYIKQNFNFKWYDIVNMTDTEVATTIYSEKIDILIDLNGHTYGNRLGIFAHKPAPIQITYLGYPNTTGLQEIDYKITDLIIDPKGSEKYYSEKLVYMDTCILTYVPMIYNAQCMFFDIHYSWKKELTDPIIFGSFNRPAKNNDELMAVWSQILAKVPNSKILIKIKSVTHDSAIIQYYLDSLKIDKDRLIITEYQNSNNDYFGLFNKIDILLDSFPYSGTTTTCDALYMSVPVVTLHENPTNKSVHPTNMSASILKSIGLDELVSESKEEYVNIAVKLANINKIYEYRQKIKNEHFPRLTDGSTFTKKYEELLINIYKRKTKVVEL